MVFAILLGYTLQKIGNLQYEDHLSRHVEFFKNYLQGCRYLTGLLNLKYTQASGIFLYSVIGLRNPEGMDVDWSTGHLYIADSGQGKILACQENGDVCTAVITHLGHPKALSIDQRNR